MRAVLSESAGALQAKSRFIRALADMGEHRKSEDLFSLLFSLGHFSLVVLSDFTYEKRRGRESNPRIAVLQTATLPLGYPAESQRT